MNTADPEALVGREPADVGEQLDQVDLDVAGVGAAAHRRRRDARAPLVLELRVGAGLALGERADDAEHVVDLVRVRVAELADRLVQRSGQRPPQRLVGARLELAGAPALADRRRAQRVEQHRLADAAQPGQHQRALRAPAGDPLEHDVERRELLVAAGELGRSLTGAGRVGVPDRVHDRTVSRCLAGSLDRASVSHATSTVPERLDQGVDHVRDVLAREPEAARAHVVAPQRARRRGPPPRASSPAARGRRREHRRRSSPSGATVVRRPSTHHRRCAGACHYSVCRRRSRGSGAPRRCVALRRPGSCARPRRSARAAAGSPATVRLSARLTLVACAVTRQRAAHHQDNVGVSRMPPLLEPTLSRVTLALPLCAPVLHSPLLDPGPLAWLAVVAARSRAPSHRPGHPPSCARPKWTSVHGVDVLPPVGHLVQPPDRRHLDTTHARASGAAFAGRPMSRQSPIAASAS